MPIELKMPALSPTMEEGTVAKWLVKEGDTVAAGDVLAEIETDKATMEFEAVDEGTIAKIVVGDGTEGVKVGTVIALIAGIFLMPQILFQAANLASASVWAFVILAPGAGLAHYLLW